MPCRTCGCPGHPPSKTWEARCSRCAGLRWPYEPSKPEPYVCVRCRGTSSAKREAARAAGKKSAASRHAKAGLR